MSFFLTLTKLGEQCDPRLSRASICALEAGRQQPSARSSKPQDQAQPWLVAAHGIERTEKAARVLAVMRGESVPPRLAALVRGIPFRAVCRGRDGDDPAVGWWRGSDRAKVKTNASLSVGSVEVFWGQDMDAWDLVESSVLSLGLTEDHEG